MTWSCGSVFYRPTHSGRKSQNDGSTLLQTAACGGHIGVMQKLLKAGLSVHAKDAVRLQLLTLPTSLPTRCQEFPGLQHALKYQFRTLE